MNDHDFGDDLRDALRPDDGIRPLDPATVIAGAHRRRRMRGLAAAAAASVAVVAIAAGGLLASGSPTGTAPAPAGPPTARTSGVLPGTPTPPRNPGSPTPPFNLPTGTPTGTPSGILTAGRTVGPNTPSTQTDAPPSSADNSIPTAAGIAAFVSRCRVALQVENPAPKPTATPRATSAGLEGITTIIADGTYWGACDNGYDATETTLRKPASIQRPSRDNLQALAVANNLLTRNGQQYEYYWAAGVLPQGVAGLRYTFPDGAGVDASVTGGFWVMKYRSSIPGANRHPAQRIKVELFAPGGSVLATRQLEWGLHTCAQISHGC